MKGFEGPSTAPLCGERALPAQHEAKQGANAQVWLRRLIVLAERLQQQVRAELAAGVRA